MVGEVAWKSSSWRASATLSTESEVRHYNRAVYWGVHIPGTQRNSLHKLGLISLCNPSIIPGQIGRPKDGCPHVLISSRMVLFMWPVPWNLGSDYDCSDQQGKANGEPVNAQQLALWEKSVKPSCVSLANFCGGSVSTMAGVTWRCWAWSWEEMPRITPHASTMQTKQMEVTLEHQ